MIPATLAIDKIKRLHFSKWPDRRNPENRLEPECWPVVSPKFKFSPGATVFTVGSCFARNVEEYLARLGFVVPMLDFTVPESEIGKVRPNGILNKYTPPSVFWELDWAARVLSAKEDSRLPLLMEPLIQLNNDEWIDAQLVGFKPVTLTRALERRRQIYRLFQSCFSADIVTITFGLLECWWDAETKTYIQQAPTKEMLDAYPTRFYFDILDYNRSLDYLVKSVEILNSAGKTGKKLIITTSPVPFGRSFSGQDAITANTYSKSVLRAISGVVANEFPNVEYFPSYESAMLSKSAEVWRDDLIHISNSFVAKIVGHLVDSFVEKPDIEVTGRVDLLSADSVAGWVFFKNHPEVILDVVIVINGKEYFVTANRLRSALKELAVHPTGLCGFMLKLGNNPLMPTDNVLVKVKQTGAIVPVKLPPNTASVLSA